MEEFLNNIFSNEILMQVIGSIIILVVHIILTYAVYKWKGGPIACFYFFLAPVAVFVLIGWFALSVMAASGSSNSNRHDHYHHF
ncbi:MAG: hypothetical protein FWB86_12905 [Treponema sp.]|nr:hypothetical protein [Treponema sp.]